MTVPDRSDAQPQWQMPRPQPLAAHGAPVRVDQAFTVAAAPFSPTPAALAGGIVAHDVQRSFGGVRAVRGMTFQVQPGRVTALVGPNGAGKTTLMLMLASLLAPDTGSIRIAGHDPVSEPQVVRRDLGWMPDVLGTWRTLTPRTMLQIVGRMHGMPSAAATVRAAELIELTGLGGLADQPSRVLSRGQQQRLGLARALVHRPRVLLLDEPAAGLDPGARHRLRGLLRSLADGGCTVLVSSHDLAELDEMADDAVFVAGGSVVAGEVLARARTARRTWRIRALDPQALVAAVHRAVPHDRIRLDGDAAEVAVDRDEDAPALLAELVRQGVPVVHFAPSVGDMERTYLSLAERDRSGGA